MSVSRIVFSVSPLGCFSSWIDGAMPMRAEIVSGYVQALHTAFVAQRLADAGVDIRPAASVEVRYRYNPGVRSIVSMVRCRKRVTPALSE